MREIEKGTTMKATRDNFMKLMNGLSTSAIINAIDKTWDTAEGEIFRDCGFEIIDGRVSEEESDKIYSDLWSKHAAA